MIEFLLHNIDDYGVPVLAAVSVVWNVCRGRRMTRSTPLIDRLSLVSATMGAVGILAAWVKWVDVGQWPVFLYLLGTVSWNGLPNVRDILINHLDPERKVHQFLRQAIGIRE